MSKHLEYRRSKTKILVGTLLKTLSTLMHFHAQADTVISLPPLFLHIVIPKRHAQSRLWHYVAKFCLARWSYWVHPPSPAHSAPPPHPPHFTHLPQHMLERVHICTLCGEVYTNLYILDSVGEHSKTCGYSRMYIGSSVDISFSTTLQPYRRYTDLRKFLDVLDFRWENVQICTYMHPWT